MKKKNVFIETLLSEIRDTFLKNEEAIAENTSKGRPKVFSLTDCLMSALAIFGLKCPSLLQFDEEKKKNPVKLNLKNLYGVDVVPSDTQMRTRLDLTDFKILPSFKGKKYLNPINISKEIIFYP